MKLELPGHASATLDALYPITPEPMSAAPSRLWLATLDLPDPLHDYLERYGAPIRYSYVTRDWPSRILPDGLRDRARQRRDAVGGARLHG